MRGTGLVGQVVEVLEEMTTSAAQRRLLEALFVKSDEDKLRRLKALVTAVKKSRSGLGPEYALVTISHLLSARVRR